MEIINVKNEFSGIVQTMTDKDDSDFTMRKGLLGLLERIAILPREQVDKTGVSVELMLDLAIANTDLKPSQELLNFVDLDLREFLSGE